MIYELGDLKFIASLKHARNTTAYVDFGAMLDALNEETFANIIVAYFRAKFDSPLGISDEDINIACNYGDLRRHLGAVPFNRMMYYLEYGNDRKPFFDNTYWTSLAIPTTQTSTLLPSTEPIHSVNAPTTEPSFDNFDIDSTLSDINIDNDSAFGFALLPSNPTSTTSASASSGANSNKRPRVEDDPVQSAVDGVQALQQQYVELRAAYVDKICVPWFEGNESKWGCYLEPIPRGTKTTTRFCRICCRDVFISASNFTAHIEKCHNVFFNVMCLNMKTVDRMKPVMNLNSVLASYNCVLFNSPCNCVECGKA